MQTDMLHSLVLMLTVGLAVWPAQGESAKPTIVLVHGAFQNGKSTWYRIAPKLEQNGYKVVVLNLPGRDNDGTDVAQLTPELYRDTVLKAIQSVTGEIILVGHSFGGVTISNVAEAVPEKVRALVYLSAYLPKDGQSLQSLAMTDKDSNLAVPGNLILSPDYKFASIKQDAKADTFANDASQPDKKEIVDSLIPEPAGPQGVPAKLTAERFGKVRKYYIETTTDHCVSPYLQESMLQTTPVTKVFKVEAGHASYITNPDAVVSAIVEVAESK